MKNRIIALVVGMILLLFTSLAAQAPDTLWTKTFGGEDGDLGFSVQQSSDSGFIIAGFTESFGAGQADVYLIKTNSFGNMQWAETYGGLSFDEGHSVQQTADGGYIIAGCTRSFGAVLHDVYLIRTDSFGDTLWTETYGGTDSDQAWSVQQTSDSGFIVVGGTYSFGSGNADIYLIRVNSSGDTLWTKTYGGSNWDYGYSVIQTPDGGYIIAGSTESFGSGGHDVYLIKIDSIGDTLWTKTYGGAYEDCGRSVRQTNDGGYIIAGWTYSFGAGFDDVYLIKADSLGDTLWTNTYGRAYSDYGHSVQQTSNGGYIITGSTELNHAALYDVYLIRTDSLGDTLWTKSWGGSNIDEGRSVKQTTDGGYVIAGWTDSYGSGWLDVYLIKTEPDVGIEEVDEGDQKSEPYIRPSVTPNPFTTMTTIDLTRNDRSNKHDLIIYDSAGRLVKSVTLATSTYELGVDLIPGIYFLKLNGASIGKVVKVR